MCCYRMRDLVNMHSQRICLQSLKESGQNNIVTVQQAGVLIIPFLCLITFGKPLMKKVIPPHSIQYMEDAQNAIENPKLSSAADFKRTAHSDCMFPFSGSGRGTKNLRKISFVSSERKLLVLSV